MGADGGNDDGRDVRLDDGPPGGEGIGRRARRGRDDKPVGTGDGDLLVIDPHRALYHTSQGALVDHYVIETVIGLPACVRFQDLPGADDVFVTGQVGVQGHEHLIQGDLGQESQASHVHAQYRHPVRGGQVGDAEQGAIPAQDDHQVDLGRQRLP